MTLGLFISLLSLCSCKQGTKVNQETALETFWKVPNFSMQDQYAKPVTLESFSNKVWVANFFFTTCKATCPMQTEKMAELQKALGDFEGRDRLRLVSFSVNPTADRPEVIKTYAEQAGAGDLWLFLTGDEAETHALSFEGFKLAVGKSETETMTHSRRFILIDTQHMIRGFYDPEFPEELEELQRDIKTLLK